VTALGRAQAGEGRERSNITVREPWARLDFARFPGTEAMMPAYTPPVV
jgi:hypothetical protein